MDFHELVPAPGVLLVAPPLMADPNFRRTVVLLCEHGPDGSFGLILNRPLDLELRDILRGLSGDELVSLGGPVQQDTLHFLHRHADIAEAIPVMDDIYWGGNFDSVKSRILAEQVTPQDMRFFLGYAGWSPEQLEEEIADGGWFLARFNGDLVFDDAPQNLWRTVLRSMGGEYALLSNFPDDPRCN